MCAWSAGGEDVGGVAAMVLVGCVAAIMGGRLWRGPRGTTQIQLVRFTVGADCLFWAIFCMVEHCP